MMCWNKLKILNRTAVWQRAEEDIVQLRNEYWNEENNAEEQINQKLHQSAILELKFQYSLWKKIINQHMNMLIILFKI